MIHLVGGCPSSGNANLRRRYKYDRTFQASVVLDAAPADSVVTLSFDSEDCDADYRAVTGRGAETIEAPQDRPWGARAAYLKGPGGLTVEIEQLLKPTYNRETLNKFSDIHRYLRIE